MIGGFNLPVYAGLLKTVAVPVVFTSLDVIGRVPARLSKAGRWYAVCSHPTPASRKDFARERERLAKWLKALPAGCAVFASNDNRARQLFDAAREAGLMAGRDLAVLGWDNDETVCETTNPPLSSIQMTAEHTGFLAARLLDRVMRRKNPDVFPPSPQMLLYVFSSIRERGSTLAAPLMSDNVVTRALEVVNRMAGNGLKVSELARELKVSVRILEMKFRQASSLSPGNPCRRPARSRFTSHDK